MVIEILASGFNFIEAPRVDDEGNVFFGEMVGRGFYRYSSADGVRLLDDSSRNIGGCAFSEDGRVIYSTRTGLMAVDPMTGKHETLAVRFNGTIMRHSVNDIEAAPNGDLFGGVIDHNGLEKGVSPDPGFLFRISRQGEVRRLRTVGISNGMDFSADGRLFLSESGEGVFSYALLPDGSIGDRRLFVDMDDSDGIAMDVGGGLWIARYKTNRLEYYDVQGRHVRNVELPFGAVTNVTFGGANWSELYVTGGHLTEKGTGGVVRFPVEIGGRASRRARIAL